MLFISVSRQQTNNVNNLFTTSHLTMRERPTSETSQISLSQAITTDFIGNVIFEVPMIAHLVNKSPDLQGL
jgi:hypothetical protein